MRWDYTKELLRSKQAEAYCRKQMEYYKEEIKLLEAKIKSQEIKITQ
ncbi:hypothetical protein LCGC14_0462220 [marine sediment metagenome]|uniref:Uncharacterized protein n=1 Tax=marine sediment metagenome TaxID=412755 RepID=A0A0F9VNL8_9ZZZZ